MTRGLLATLVLVGCVERGTLTVVGDAPTADPVVDTSVGFVRETGVVPDPPDPVDTPDTDTPSDTEPPAPPDADGDGVPDADDCAPNDAFVFPGADEICNAVDDDCDTVVDNTGACPCPTTTRGSRLYMTCGSLVAWGRARQVCDNAGMKLVQIDDANEESFVRGLSVGPFPLGETWWIGASDIGNEGTFVWTDGSPVTYDNWRPGEPNDIGGEDCVELSTVLEGWNDARCTNPHPFVCEAD
jgi:hypothetical protein